jgi:hypothetical protein
MRPRDLKGIQNFSILLNMLNVRDAVGYSRMLALLYATF